MNIIKKLTVAALVLIFSSSSALALSIYTLDIQTELSEITYSPFFPIGGGSAPPEVFEISGRFSLIVDTDSYYQTVLRFEPINISTPTLSQGPFNFPTFPLGYDGLLFSDNGDPCNYFDLPGSCASMGNFGYAVGSFDGFSLKMSGEAPIDYFESYSYSIQASVVESSSVPEPSTFMLLGSSVLALGVIRFRKSYNEKNA